MHPPSDKPGAPPQSSLPRSSAVRGAPPGLDDLRPGSTLAGRYRLVRLLGEGGMGVVWEARQLTTERSVAIKILKSRDAADASRFLREAKVSASFSHRSIVQVFDFWEVPGGGPVFMVMELLVGETLAAWRARAGRLAVQDALSVLVPVARALRVAHGQGIVHRDMKPENIFLARPAEGGPPEVKVLDFGLARPVTADALNTAITQTGSLMGTPYYMAPEQMYGEKDVDVRADVWAFGVILYECVCGERPFGGENFGQVFRHVTSGVFRPMAELAPHAAPALASLVARMLSHDRNVRPNMADICRVLSSSDAAAPLVAQTTRRMPSSLTPEEAPAHSPDDPALAPPDGAAYRDPPRPAPPPATMTATAASVRAAVAAPRRGAIGLGFGLVALAAVAAGLGLALRGSPRGPAAIALPSLPEAALAPSASPAEAATLAAPRASPRDTMGSDAPAVSPSPPRSAPVTATVPVQAAPARPAPAAVATAKATRAAPSRSASAPAPDPLHAGRF